MKKLLTGIVNGAASPKPRTGMINFGALYELLEINNDFEDGNHLHNSFYKALGRDDFIEMTPGKSTIKALCGNLDEHEAAGTTPPVIAYSKIEQDLDQSIFSLLISADVHAVEETAVFGLQGFINAEGNMELWGIMAPYLDENGEPTKPWEIPLTPQDIEMATYFARECALQVYSAKPLDVKAAMENMMQAANAHIGAERPLLDIY